jgi:hypothetical protein
MADRLITTMEKNSQEEIRFSLQEYRGTELIDIRVYYDPGSGNRKPTKKGISVPVDRFDEFMTCLGKVRKEIGGTAG